MGTTKLFQGILSPTKKREVLSVINLLLFWHKFPFQPFIILKPFQKEVKKKVYILKCLKMIREREVYLLTLPILTYFLVPSIEFNQLQENLPVWKEPLLPGTDICPQFKWLCRLIKVLHDLWSL